MIVSAIQYMPPRGNPEKALEEIGALIRKADGSDLIVLPEMATSGYIWNSIDELMPFAENRDGRTFSMLSKLAIQMHTWIVCGYPEKEDGIIYNSALVIAPDGSLAANYRKVFLFETDLLWAQPGIERISVPTSFGLMTPGICMDLNDNGLLHMHHG
jgi:N-carbamoylputrescine amidase